MGISSTISISRSWYISSAIVLAWIRSRLMNFMIDCQSVNTVENRLPFRSVSRSRSARKKQVLCKNGLGPINRQTLNVSIEMRLCMSKSCGTSGWNKSVIRLASPFEKDDLSKVLYRVEEDAFYCSPKKVRLLKFKERVSYTALPIEESTMSILLPPEQVSNYRLPWDQLNVVFSLTALTLSSWPPFIALLSTLNKVSSPTASPRPENLRVLTRTRLSWLMPIEFIVILLAEACML